MKESDDLWRKVSSIEEGGVEGIEEPEKERNDNHHAILYPQNHRFHIKYSLIVRDLSYHCTERDLYTLFDSLSSPNIRITIKRSPRDGRSLLHGFVDCKEEEERDALIERFHLHKFMGRRIKLEACDSNQQKMQAFDAHPSEYQVHVRYESLTSESHGRVTEEVLENECMRYGEIVDIVIKRHSETLGSGSMSSFVCNQRGYAFIYFSDVDGVRRAVASSPVMLFNGKIRCDLSIPKLSNRTEDKLPHKEITVSSSFSSSSFHQYYPFPVSPSPPPSHPLPISLPPPINTSNNMVVSPPVIYSVSPTHIQQSYSVIVTRVSPTASMTPLPVPYYPSNSPIMYYHPYHSPISQQIYPIGNNQIMDYYQSYPQNIGPFPVSTGREASSSRESITRNTDYQTQPLSNTNYLQPSAPPITPSLSSSNRDNSNYSETFVETQYEDIVRDVYDDPSTSTNSLQQQGGKRGLRNRRRSSQKHVNNMKSF